MASPTVFTDGRSRSSTNTLNYEGGKSRKLLGKRFAEITGSAAASTIWFPEDLASVVGMCREGAT